MSSQPNPTPIRLDAETLRTLVHHGVGLFGSRRMAPPDPLFETLKRDYRPGALLGLPSDDWQGWLAELAAHPLTMGGPLGRLTQDFKLTLPELFVLTLCGEIEDSHLLNLAIATLQSPSEGARPGIHLVCALMADLFDEDVTPTRLIQHPLLRLGALRVEGEGPLPLRQLRMSAELWAVFTGHPQAWQGSMFLSNPHPAQVSSQLREQLPQLARLVRDGVARGIVLRGGQAATRLAAVALAEALGLRPLAAPRATWQQDRALALACRYAGWLPVLSVTLGAGERLDLAQHEWLTPLVVCCGQDGAIDAEGMVEIDLPGPTRAERQQLWRDYLGDALDSRVLAECALLDGAVIGELASQAKVDAARRDEAIGLQHLIRARSQRGCDRLRLLAQPVPHQVDREALVLSAALTRQFDQLIARCRRREALWEGLGTTLVGAPSPGVRALFSGDSGTGKTLAAAHLATELGAPLYRLDLAAVMNKYIGETEKNLGLLLDEAAANDVILLMDEADALFGQRSDGDGNGERFANMLTNFLLTRIEAHPGIVLLTSNSRNRIDPAFTRRLDAVLEFPLPGFDERLAIWRTHLGSRTPGDELAGLLASYCELPGGFVRNAVLNAAAREPGGVDRPLSAAGLVIALREEYRKLGRAMPANLAQVES